MRLAAVVLVALAGGVCLPYGRALATAQFPGQGDSTKRSAAIIDRERAERESKELEADGIPRILVPGKDDRVQIDRWTYAASVSGIDPLTQIIRFTPPGRSGTGFFLDDCRVMTNLHVISDKDAVDDGELVGEEFEYESLPIPWFDNARAVGRVMILGHGKGAYRRDLEILPAGADQDWAIGYDLGCASKTYDLGTVHLGPPVRDLSELGHLQSFTAGFTAVRMPGLSNSEFPLYIDSRCRMLKRSTWATSRSHYETNCSMERGGSGQPLLSGLLADPQNPNVFLSERGRPRLTVYALFHAGGGYNADVPNFLTRAYVILFDQEMMRRFEPFLHGPVNLEALRRHPRESDDAQPLLKLRARYTETARRRRIEGRVAVDFTVRADGTVARATLFESLDPGGLDALALAAAQRWVFEPARRGGIAIPSSVLMSLPFYLPPE